jgi:hypothetical protein
MNERIRRIIINAATSPEAISNMFFSGPEVTALVTVLFSLIFFHLLSTFKGFDQELSARR